MRIPNGLAMGGTVLAGTVLALAGLTPAGATTTATGPAIGETSTSVNITIQGPSHSLKF
jgi:hypothetical protein